MSHVVIFIYFLSMVGEIYDGAVSVMKFVDDASEVAVGHVCRVVVMSHDFTLFRLDVIMIIFFREYALLFGVSVGIRVVLSLQVYHIQ